MTSVIVFVTFVEFAKSSHFLSWNNYRFVSYSCNQFYDFMFLTCLFPMLLRWWWEVEPLPLSASVPSSSSAMLALQDMNDTVDIQDVQKIFRNKCCTNSPHSLQRHPLRFLGNCPQRIVLQSLRELLDKFCIVDNQEGQKNFLCKCDSLVRFFQDKTRSVIHHDNCSNLANSLRAGQTLTTDQLGTLQWL